MYLSLLLKHLPASLLQFAVKHKGDDRIALVTDATRFGGMEDGAEKQLGISNVIIEDGVAKLPDRSAFAGSICTSNRLVRNMIQLAGVSLLDAVKMITVNPARMAGLQPVDKPIVRLADQEKGRDILSK